MSTTHTAIRTEESLSRALLHCFSLRRNCRSLCSLRPDDTMGCLDGMRSLSMAWVVFGHTLVYAIGPGGMQYAAELLPKGWADGVPKGVLAGISVPPEGGRISRMSYQLLPAAFFAVDTFFWMSGVLTALALIKQMRHRGLAWARLYPIYALGRWLRLTPLVAVTIGTSIGLLPSLGDGPLYEMTSREGEACAAGGWWVDLLYAQNLVSLADSNSKLGGCERHMWYLANDMQFYLFAPVVVFPFLRWRRLGWSFLGTLLLGSTVANAVISATNHYAASPLFDMTYFTRVYIQPWTRAQPFLVGVGFAMLWDYRQEERAQLKRREGLLGNAFSDRVAGSVDVRGGHNGTARVMASRKMSTLLCAFAAVVMLLTAFGTYGLYQSLPSSWGDAQNVAYISFSRLGWAVALSAIGYVCFTKRAPLTNAVLSWWPFQLWGKLAFGIYVIHPLLMTALYYGETRPIAFSDAWYAAAFTTNLLWASALALCLWLFVEKPSANVVALIFAKCVGD